MTPEDEIRVLRLEKRNAELVAENCKLKKQVGDLTRMYQDAQRFIGKLQASIKRQGRNLAEQVFKNG